MNGIRIICEIGSTHMGKWEYCKEAIDRCYDMGVNAIKFQLFPNQPDYTSSGNVYLPQEKFFDVFHYAHDKGLDCSASVFDDDSFEFLMSLNPSFIKIAYSKRHKRKWMDKATTLKTEVIVSSDMMHPLPETVTKLFCVPRYPVYERISFEGIFERFHGFSDHTLGYEQTVEAVQCGATVIEKHMKLYHSDIQCPDALFALTPGEFSMMATSLRKLS